MKLIEPSLVDLVWQQFWQCSLLVLVVYLMCRLIKFRRAHLSFLLWLLVLLKFMTPPLWTSSSGLFCWVQVPFHSELRQVSVNQGPQSLTRTESIQLMTGGDLRKLPDVETKSSPFTVTIRDVDPNESRYVPTDQKVMITQPAVTKLAVIKTERRSSGYTLLDLGLIVWTLVALLILGVMGVRYWRCKRIIWYAGEQLHPELNQLLERLCKELKVKRRVRLLITKSRMGPAVMGLFRPTIILPEVITDARSLKELEPILAHELIHIRRGDLWVGLLQLMASVVWWFNPLVWFSGRRLKFEIEQCCDEEVLAELNCDPGIYAKCLLEVLELKQSLKTVPVVPGVRPVEITSKRLERIMRLGQGCQKRTPWWCWMIFVGLMIVILPGAAFVVSADDQQNKPVKISQKEIIKQNKPVSEEPQTTSSTPLSSELLALLPPESIPLKFQRNQSAINTFPIQFLWADIQEQAEIEELKPILLKLIIYQLNDQLETQAVKHGKNKAVTADSDVIDPWILLSSKDYCMLSRKDDRILMIKNRLLVMSEDPRLSQDISRILQFVKSLMKFHKAEIRKRNQSLAMKKSAKEPLLVQNPEFEEGQPQRFPVDRPEGISTRVGVAKSNAPQISSYPIKKEVLKEDHGDTYLQAEFDLYNSTELPYLSSDINMRGWLSQTIVTRTHSIKELLARARKEVGAEKAVSFLLDQIDTRMKELDNLLPARDKSQYRISMPVDLDDLKIPLKDKRNQNRISFYSFILIENDQLVVRGTDPIYHKQIKQVLAKLAEVEFTQFKLTAKFISVPKRVVDKLRVRHKKMKIFTTKQVTFELYKDEKQVVNKEQETVRHHSMIWEVLDAEHRHAFVQKLMASNQTKVTEVPQVVLKNNQIASVVSKRASLFEKRFAGQRFRLKDYAVSLDLRPIIPERGSSEERVMLDYKWTFSKTEGRGNLKKTDLARGTERTELVELIKEQHFKDVAMIQPGQTLVVGGFEVAESAYDSRLLLVLLDVEKVGLEQGQVMQGVGVNSDAGVTGQIVIDEPKNQKTLVTETYPVADLVMPLPRKVSSPGYYTAASQARFEPLIELIKQNITPEDWEDAQNRGGYLIVPDEKTLSLIIRHTRKGHDQIIKLLEKLRAIQDSLFTINLNLFQTDDLRKSLKIWEPSEDPRVRSLLKQMKSKNLKDGIIISVQQAGLFRRIVSAQSPMTPKSPMTSIRLVNGQTGEAVVSDSPMRPQKSNARVKVQVRPELLKDQQLRLSMAINPKDALDALSNLKNITLPKESFALFDITDQVVGKESAFLPYQRFNQVEQKSKNQKQFFLLVAPSVSSMTAFDKCPIIPPRPIPPQPAR